MGRRLRFIPAENTLVEVTTRTFQGRYLLKPSPAANDAILGVMGRAQRLYPVEIHAFAFMSNHYHMLISVPDAQRMAQFVGYLNSNIARELGRMHGWREKFWGRRYQAIVVSEEEAAQEGRMKYLLSQGVKEGLVTDPREWSGVHSANALAEGRRTLTGRWRKRTHEYWERVRRGHSPAVFTQERVHLSSLPCWAHRSPKEQVQRVRELIDLVVAEGSSSKAESLEGELPDLSATYCPPRLKRSPAPMFHCATRKMRRALYRAYDYFLSAYRDASEQLRYGNLTAAFPSGSFPPPRPFVSLFIA